MAEAKKKREVQFTNADREKVAALYEEILSRQKVLFEIAKTALIGAHPALRESLDKAFKGPITISPSPDHMFLRWCAESTLENRCLCVDDTMCWACNSEEGYPA